MTVKCGEMTFIKYRDISLTSIHNIKRFRGKHIIDIEEEDNTDYDIASSIPLVSTSFVWVDMPRGSETILSYMMSFGVNECSVNTCKDKWRSSHIFIPFIGFTTTSNNYFAKCNGVRLIDGHATDLHDWSVFNFDVANVGGRNDSFAFFGGTDVNGGTGSLNVNIASIWGYNKTNHANPWTLLWLFPLGVHDTMSTRKNTGWWNMGGTICKGFGKYDAYDTLPITRIGFAVA